jgi:hypothetical protein
LQRRLDAENIKKAAAAAMPAAAPVFNFSIGKEIIDFFRPQPAAAPAPLAAVLPQAAAAVLPQATAAIPQSPPQSPQRIMQLYDLNCPTLLQGNRNPGIDMTMKEFCAQYGVENGAEEKLVMNSYGHARLFSFVTIQELKDMKFLPGETASLRDAVHKWSAP